ncbi:MAG: hypothetical protein GY844_19365 [Bradyrhizobium sp.]|nr:hypothetical protein [Bradyrhizobium sp.]
MTYFYPVPDRRGVSMKNLTRPAQKTVYEPVQNISTMKEGRDFSLDKARPYLANAIDAQINCDDASDNLIKEKPHSNIRSSGPDWIARPYLVLVQMRE